MANLEEILKKYDLKLELPEKRISEFPNEREERELYSDYLTELLRPKRERVKESRIKSLEEILSPSYFSEDTDKSDPEKYLINTIYNITDDIEKLKLENKSYNKELYSMISYEKELEFISKKITTSLNKNLSSAQFSPLGFSMTIKDSVSITAENIAEFALPIVEYIRATQPDYVIACDRGARYLGLAVHRLYRELYGRFPTVDGSLRFRRISKSNSIEETSGHLKPMVDEMLKYRERPKVLVLDDWVVSGSTKRIAQQVFDMLSNGRIRVSFGVLVGGNADVSGHGYNGGFASVTDWRDDSNIIGISYGRNYGGNGIRARSVRTEQAKHYRQRMYKAVRRFASGIKNRHEQGTQQMHYTGNRPFKDTGYYEEHAAHP